MLCKYYLMVGSSIVDIDNQNHCIDASNMITNLSEIKASYTRSGLGGVVRKCGSRFSFAFAARDLLIKEYRSKYLKSQASIAIYAITNNWTYIKAWECPLDFSSFSWDTHLASINCLDNSAAAIIKANKSTQYEYPVAELKELSQLHYDGVKVRNEATFELCGNSVEGQSYSTSEVVGGSYCIWIPPFNKITDKLSVNNAIQMHDQVEALTAGRSGGWEDWLGPGPNTNTTSYFLECLQDCVVSLDFTNIKIWGYNAGMTDPYGLGLVFLLFKIPTSGWPEPLLGQIPTLRGTEHTYHCDLSGSFSLIKGEKLQLGIMRYSLIGATGIGTTTFYMPNDSGLAAWNGIAAPIDVDVVTPKVLLNNILESMSGSVEVLGEIKETVFDQENNRLKNTLLVASESIRGMKDAKIYSSFNKFCDFMEAEFGYVYAISPCEPSTPGIRDEVLKDYLEFEGFFVADDVILSGFTVPDGLSYKVKCSGYEGYESIFYAYASDGKYYIAWPDSDKYQEYGDWFATSLKVDTHFRDKTTDIYYYTKEEAIKVLHEYVFDKISTKEFDAISHFGGFERSIVFLSDTYTGNVEASHIVYASAFTKFLYKEENAYYPVFNGAESYNTADGPRKDVLFVDINDLELHEDGQVYVVVNNTSLVKCKGDVPTLVKVDEASLVTFKHRSEVFKNQVIKRIQLFTEPEYVVSSDRIHSELQIGYEKQDYDNGNNGYDEFNFTNYYTTGITIKGSTLRLVCPYRADCYGFEELAEKRGSETSSTDTDAHIFLVNVLPDKSDKKYIIDRTLKVEGAYTETVFNAAYAPAFMIEANKGYIGMFTQRLRFASSDGNSSIAIDGKKVSSDVKINGRLFTSGDITIRTNDIELPEDWEGIVQFDWDGYVFQGFLKSVDANFHRNEAFEYELIEKEQICLQ